MKKELIVIVIILGTTLLVWDASYSSHVTFADNSDTLVYSEEFEHEYFDGNTYTLNYEIRNGFLIDKETEKDSYFVFKVDGTNGTITLTIPKTVPNSMFDLFVLYNGEEIKPHIYELSCNKQIIVDFDGYSEIEFIYNTLLGKSIVRYTELPEACWEKDENKIQQEFKSIQCPPLFEKGLNIREEAVCTTKDSFDKLYKRGYLISYPTSS